MTGSPILLHALISDRQGEAEGAIAALVGGLIARGVKLAGVMQAEPGRPRRCRCDSILRDLSSGREISIAQELGAGARGCRLDHGALETAAEWVEASLEAGVEALVINKFGKREAEGHGFRPAMASAAALGIPAITTLAPGNREAWEAFSGCYGALYCIERADEIVSAVLSDQSRSTTCSLSRSQHPMTDARPLRVL